MNKILRNTDGVDGGQSDGLNFLEGDMSAIDTSFPLIPDSLQVMEIVEVTKEANKQATGSNFVIKMKTTKDCRAQGTGDLIPAGFPAKSYIGLVASDEYPESSIKKAVATLCQAAGVKSYNPLEQFTGKLVTCKVTTRPAKNGFEASNNFRFVPLGK